MDASKTQREHGEDLSVRGRAAQRHPRRHPGSDEDLSPTIPIRRAIPPRLDAGAVKNGDPGTHRTRRDAPLVLFVDDEVPVLEALRCALRREPLRATFATSVQEAFAVLEHMVVDVVVSDDRMPGMSGTEFLAAVRDEYPAIQRILLTGSATLDVAARAIRDGEVYAFLTKPYDATALAGMIHDAVAARTAQDDVVPGVAQGRTGSIPTFRLPPERRAR